MCLYDSAQRHVIDYLLLNVERTINSLHLISQTERK